MLNQIFAKLFGSKFKESQNAKTPLEQEDTFYPHFQKVTAKDIAQTNDITYISDACGMKLYSDGVNRLYARENKYILLHPANDGLPTCPIEWFGNFDGKPKLIMDNQTSFKEITNLSEILLQMIKLYEKYINEEIFISSDGFAIKLEDKLHPNYHGKASFVLTADSIRNKKVKPSQIIEAKKYFINEFLDHYIGWNFGVVIKNDPELEKALLEFNALVIQKGLREFAGNGFDVWQSPDVQHYKLKTS